MRPAQLLAAVFAVSSVTAAWPDVLDNVNAIADVKHVLYGRQDDAESSSSRPTRTTAAPSTEKEESSEPTETGTSKKNDNESKETGTATAKSTGKESGTKKATGSTKTTGKPKETEYDPRLPAGGVSMITPAPIAGPQYYKIGEWVTFAWNYTSLSKTPSAIDILATCTANQATYTLAVNQTVGNSTGMILWDTEAYQASATVPLLTETYTLIIYDSESSISATPRAGYLGAFNQFTFGMYTPRPYVKWEDYTCANCIKNFGLSSFEALTLKAMLITSGTTVASLLYFAFSFGLI